VTKDEIKDIDRKMDNYIRKLVSNHGYGELVTKDVVNYGYTIGWDEAHAEKFKRMGMSQEACRIARTYSSGRNPKRPGTPMSATIANKRDVSNFKNNGVDVNVGDVIRKDVFACTEKQLIRTLRVFEKNIAGHHEQYMYNVAIYELRFEKQYKLPFDIPIDTQIKMKKQAEEDLRLRQAS
jgi:hypothetical protein